MTMDGLSRHTAVCACAAKVETRDEVVWARCNAGEVFFRSNNIFESHKF